MDPTSYYLSGVLIVAQQVKTYSLECDANAVQAPWRPLHAQCSPATEKLSGKPASCAGPHVPSLRGSTYKYKIVFSCEITFYFPLQ